MNFPFNRAVALLVVSSAFLFAVTSCSKSGGSSSSGLSASVNGTAWANSYTVAGIYYTGGYFFDIAGAQFKGGDTTAFELVIYTPFTLNQAISSDTSQTVISYIDGKTGNAYTGAYGTGHAIVTVTSIDTASTTGKIGGTFTGVLWNIANSNDSLVIANGKFNSSVQKQ